MPERRARARLQGSYRVAVTILTAPEAPRLVDDTFFCSTEDLSSGGLRIYTDRSVPVGTHLKLRIVFGWSYWEFSHTGRVVWVDEKQKGRTYQLGVEFTNPPGAAQTAWADILESKLAAGEAPKPAIRIGRTRHARATKAGAKRKRD